MGSPRHILTAEYNPLTGKYENIRDTFSIEGIDGVRATNVLLEGKEIPMKVYLVFQRDQSEEYDTHVSAVFLDEEKAKAEVESLQQDAITSYSTSEDPITDADELEQQHGLEFWYQEAEVTE